MATKTFNESFIVKDKDALERLDAALKLESKFEHVKPITDEESKKSAERAKQWISSK